MPAKCDCGCSQSPTGRLRKSACGDCGAIHYSSRAVMREPGLGVCGCGGGLDASCLNDRALYDESGAWAIYLEQNQGRSLVGRKDSRATTNPEMRHRCGAPGCMSFIAGPRATCKRCGFNNGSGRYSETSYAPAIPF